MKNVYKLLLVIWFPFEVIFAMKEDFCERAYRKSFIAEFLLNKIYE